ncbi:MAG: UDP-N-acetylmuramoyl-L-alanyl-D-glutamate--2,6-diaminopimelate ligase [Gammaproteobacteria bacterium]|nr:UDP-N-acetylmuramoyl-L-alanyl-D-glutamate--2,6-diaminopimelate ligase [Gammaproteobacteria bacterium]
MTLSPSTSNGVSLGELLSDFPIPASCRDRSIGSLAMDSRQVHENGLFLACSGGSQHGLDHLSEALESGAVGVLYEPDERWVQEKAERLSTEDAPLIPVPNLGKRVSEIAGRFYSNPSQHLDVIGFTGTNGKTSCTHFLARALAPDTPCGIIGTLGNGFPDALEGGTHTTPDPVQLQALMSDLLARGARAVAMEVSSHALEQGRAAAIRFDTAALTNISRDHLDYHGSMERYAKSKKRLYDTPGLSSAVLNINDSLGCELAKALPTDLTRIGYGSGEKHGVIDRLDSYVWATGIETSLSGMRISIESTWGGGELHSPLLGRFNASNLLAVLAVLLHREYSLEEAVRRLSTLRTVPGRMESFGGAALPLVVVDYAHTPDALEHVLAALRDHVEGRLICVFGCGGDRDRGKRPQMGGIAESLADGLFVTDDNPRGEDPDRIVREILAGMKTPGDARVIHDRALAIRTALEESRAGDLVLVAGKGHEAVQQVGDRRIPFSDCDQVSDVLGGMAR